MIKFNARVKFERVCSSYARVNRWQSSKRHCSPQKRYYHLVIMCTRLLMVEPSNTSSTVFSYTLVRGHERKEDLLCRTYRREAQGSRDEHSVPHLGWAYLSRN